MAIDIWYEGQIIVKDYFSLGAWLFDETFHFFAKINDRSNHGEHQCRKEEST
jgi:hypothetical protein